MPAHLQNSMNQAHLENGTFEQIVSHPKKELELNGLEAPDELQIKTVTPKATQQNPKNPNQFATTAKSQITIETSAVISNEKKTKPETTRIVLTLKTIIIVVTQTLTPTIKILTIPTPAIQIFKKTENLHLSNHPVRTVVKLTIAQRNVTLERTQRTDHLPETNGRKDKIKSNRATPKATQLWAIIYEVFFGKAVLTSFSATILFRKLCLPTTRKKSCFRRVLHIAESLLGDLALIF